MVFAKSRPTFSLSGKFTNKRFPAVSRVIEGSIERLFALDQLEDKYQKLPPTRDLDHFLSVALDALDIECAIGADELTRIPARGPVIVVANHPFGAVEGVMLAQQLRRVRGDVRILANQLLERIPELSELFIAVDVFGGTHAVQANIAPLRRATRWLTDGGLLVVFPAGTVSHFQLRRASVTDPHWNPNIARLAKRTGADVVPVYIPGGNSALFQIAGLLHPRLRTALLPRELLNKARARVRFHVGEPIASAQLRACASDAEVMQYLRMATYMLADRESAPAVTRGRHRTRPAQLARVGEAIAPALLRAEVEALPAVQCLVESGEFMVVCAQARQIPWCLQEIGRLRELSFRAAGEGTGRATDIDLFDAYYRHLFVWDARACAIVGAYRIGLADEILARIGPRGLYTHSLFKYGRQLLDHVNPALELGRSFVREDYQKSFAPLLLLWRGIGQFVVNDPRYAVMFGPVSISNDYTPLSRRLLVDYLRAHAMEKALARHVKPRRPFRAPPSTMRRELDVAVLRGVEGVSRLVARIERDNKGMPILLKQYLKLGGRTLAFSADENFGNALDGLIMVDLRRSDPRVLARYMGAQGAEAFLAYHRVDSDFLRCAS